LKDQRWPLQCRSELGDRPPALGGLQFHCFQDCCLGLGRDTRYHSSGGDKLFLSRHLQRSFRWDLAREHGIESRSQGVDVRPLGGAHSVLLWRSITWSHCPGPCESGHTRGIYLGDAKVHQHRLALGGNLYVPWLHIAMDDRWALTMQILQGIEHLANPGQGYLLGNCTLPLDH
jgi:hypothetical protein